MKFNFVSEPSPSRTIESLPAGTLVQLGKGQYLLLDLHERSSDCHRPVMAINYTPITAPFSLDGIVKTMREPEFKVIGKMEITE